MCHGVEQPSEVVIEELAQEVDTTTREVIEGLASFEAEAEPDVPEQLFTEGAKLPEETLEALAPEEVTVDEEVDANNPSSLSSNVEMVEASIAEELPPKMSSEAVGVVAMEENQPSREQ